MQANSSNSISFYRYVSIESKRICILYIRGAVDMWHHKKYTHTHTTNEQTGKHYFFSQHLLCIHCIEYLLSGQSLTFQHLKYHHHRPTARNHFINDTIFTFNTHHRDTDIYIYIYICITTHDGFCCEMKILWAKCCLALCVSAIVAMFVIHPSK